MTSQTINCQNCHWQYGTLGRLCKFFAEQLPAPYHKSLDSKKKHESNFTIIYYTPEVLMSLKWSIFWVRFGNLSSSFMMTSSLIDWPASSFCRFGGWNWWLTVRADINALTDRWYIDNNHNHNQFSVIKKIAEWHWAWCFFYGLRRAFWRRQRRPLHSVKTIKELPHITKKAFGLPGTIMWHENSPLLLCLHTH